MTTNPARPLAGKTALVTGASRGIGAGLATELAAQGAKVAITYWSSPERAEQVVKAIQDGGGDAVAIRADNSTADGARAGVREAAEKLGSLDILVNNAGGGWFEPFQDATDEHIDHTINLNIRGTVYATQEAIKHLPDGGRIITIGSINAESLPFPDESFDAVINIEASHIYPHFERFLAGFKQQNAWLPGDLAHRLARAYGTRVKNVIGNLFNGVLVTSTAIAPDVVIGRSNQAPIRLLIVAVAPIVERLVRVIGNAHGRLPRWARDIADTEDILQETLTQTLKQLRRIEIREEDAIP